MEAEVPAKKPSGEQAGSSCSPDRSAGLPAHAGWTRAGSRPKGGCDKQPLGEERTLLAYGMLLTELMT
jgi:hypothetical protein